MFALVWRAALTFLWAAPGQLGLLAQSRPGFTADVAPVLQQRCVVCHGPDKSRGHFRLDTFADLLKPGSSGKPTIVSGQPEASHLYQLIVEPNEDERMPQKAEALPPNEITTIRAWIAAGAKFDGPRATAPLASYLPRAIPSSAPERYDRPWPVTALAFSHDGGQLVASGYHEITFWDPKSSALLRRLRGTSERTHAIVWQPGGRLLAVAGGTPGRSGELLLVDPTSDRPPAELARASDEMLCAAFSPDGQSLAVGGADNALRIFEVKSGVERMRLEQHSDWVHGVSFSPDGRWLASASRDRTARVYNLTNGEAVSIFRNHEAPVESVEFVDEGTSICSAGADHRVRRWEGADGSQAREFARFDEEITALAAGDGSLFIGLADGRIIQRRLSNGDEAGEYIGSSDLITAVACQTEYHWLAAGSHDGRVRLWDLREGVPLAEFIACPGLQAGALK